MFLLRASFLDEEVPLLVSVRVLKQFGSVIDVAGKTIEFQTFHNVKGPSGKCGGSFDYGSPAGARFCASDTVDVTDVGTGGHAQGQEATILRPSSEKVWSCHQSHILLPQLPHRKKTLAITKLTQRTVRQMFRVVMSKPQVCRTI